MKVQVSELYHWLNYAKDEENKKKLCQNLNDSGTIHQLYHYHKYKKREYSVIYIHILFNINSY